MTKAFLILGYLFISFSTIAQQEEMVFSVVETPPVFIGGNDALKRFIIKHMIWPKEALENKILGTVSANFIVEKDGTITQPAIDSPRLCNGCDEEVLRLLSIMPKWKPGEQSRRKVRVRYQIPISFNPADYQK